ncbi:MAG: hypothetical protein ACRC20_13945 [Segniliparus sp.]|uniref:hypothetical protein n=1 Tax=Segniliparus sp. TaxID=2804064 RepID=UPI003F2B57EB
MEIPDSARMFNASKLAEQSGVSVATITNWSSLADRPLRAHVGEDGKRLFRWGDLIEFLDAHPGLPAAAKAAKKIRTNPHGSAGVSGPDRETLKAIAREIKAAAIATADATLRAAEHQRDIAHEMAETQLQMVRDLCTTVKALDNALTLALAPNTLND